jgi:hypothetical protein
VILYYREFGTTEFRNMEMQLSGRNAIATIPAKSVVQPYIEYYIYISLRGGMEATFPQENPVMNPLKVPVKGVDLKDSEVRFLSPESGETLAAEDLAVAVSLMYASDAVDRSRTRIFLDGIDVSSEAIISDDVLLYRPQNFDRSLTLGPHSVRIELIDTSGNFYHSKQTEFELSTSVEIEEARRTLQYTGNGQLELRNEKIETSSTTYIRGDIRLNGTYDFLAFGGDIHLTNEEKSYLQPQNRFLAVVQAAEYAKIQIGDAYPVFPTLLVNGKRVRGISGSFSVKFFNLDVSYGQTERAVDGTPIVDTVYSSGTYARNFFAIRPSFGSGEHFQFGLTYLRSKDDIGSISHGAYPKDNAVAGADLLLALDDQKVRWVSQVAASVENTDISQGDFTDDDFIQSKLADAQDAADSVRALKEAQDLIDAAKIARKFITVNEHLSPLNPLKGAPSVAYESDIYLNYFGNFLRMGVFRKGIAYKSYGNEFIQNDILGFNISDRIRFFDNRIMTSVSYETKHNNTQNDALTPTTTYNTLGTSVTAYPGAELPTFTVGYGFYSRKNPIDLSQFPSTSPLLMDADTEDISKKYPASWDSIRTACAVVPSEAASLVANDFTNRFYLSLNYDFRLFTRQTAVASMSIASKKDRTFYKRDQDNFNVSLSMNSYYEIPLQTILTVVISHNAVYSAQQDTVGAYLNSTQKQVFDYQTVSLGARYRMMENRLNLSAAVAPSFGDFKRLLIQTAADYQLSQYHYLTAQFDFISNPERPNDIVVSILYRFMM